MALDTNELTIETVGLDGADLPNVPVLIQLADPMLARSGMPTETIVPHIIETTTGATGAVTVDLLPSSIVGTYQITLNESFVRRVDMPNSNARLSDLTEVSEDA